MSAGEVRTFGKKAVGNKTWKKLLQSLPCGGMLIIEVQSRLTTVKQLEVPQCQGFLSDLLQPS